MIESSKFSKLEIERAGGLAVSAYGIEGEGEGGLRNDEDSLRFGGGIEGRKSGLGVGVGFILGLSLLFRQFCIEIIINITKEFIAL